MKPADDRLVRCAIYARVSTDAGLDQEFNSLDAQDDASQADIRSRDRRGAGIREVQAVRRSAVRNAAGPAPGIQPNEERATDSGALRLRICPVRAGKAVAAFSDRTPGLQGVEQFVRDLSVV